MATDSKDFEALAAQVRATVADCGLGHTLSVSVVEDGHPRLRISWSLRDDRSDAIDFPANAEWVDRVCRLVRAIHQKNVNPARLVFDLRPPPEIDPGPAVIESRTT